MPFNLLLLPLLAGYIFLSRSNLRSYSTSQLSKDQLLLHASIVGLILLMVSRLICVLLLSTDAGLKLAIFLHKLAPFPFIGSALGTVALAAILMKIGNVFISEQVAGFWLYHRGKFDPLSRILWCSFVGVTPQRAASPTFFTCMMAGRILGLIWRIKGIEVVRLRFSAFIGVLKIVRDEEGLALSGLASGLSRPVMLCMKDGKVIVGYVTDILTDKPNIEFVTIAPVWTGFRDSATNKIFKTTDYSRALRQAKDPDKLSRVIRTAEISWATMFSETAFRFQAPTPPEIPDLKARLAAQSKLRKESAK